MGTPGSCGRRILVAIALGASALAAVPASAHEVPGALGGERFYMSAPTKSQVAQTRARFFGARNVDPRSGEIRRDRLIFSWFGVTNFAMAIRGHVILLDAWVPRGAHSNWVPTTPAELATLDPELILLGHAHFDHAADAVPIAQASGATIVGTGEHCEAMVARAPANPPRCISAIPLGARPGHLERPRLIKGVHTTVVKHLHSAVTENDGYHMPVLPAPSLTPIGNPPTTEDLLDLIGDIPDAEGGTELWRFRVGDFTFAWNDSSGPLVDRAPGLLKQLHRLGPVDVHLGAIQGFNQFSNGMRDAIDYIEALRPATFIPTHHDDWAFGITTRAIRYRDPFFAELAEIPETQRPEVRFIRDPADYVNPRRLTFQLPGPP